MCVFDSEYGSNFDPCAQHCDQQCCFLLKSYLACNRFTGTGIFPSSFTVPGSTCELQYERIKVIFLRYRYQYWCRPIGTYRVLS